MPPPKRSFRPAPEPEPRPFPSTPPFREESWRAERRMTPEEVAPYLAALKATISSKPSDPAQAARYLDACKTRKREDDTPPF